MIAAGHIVLGTLFGYVLARIRFTSWHEVNLMFSLRDLRLVATFALAVVLLAGIWRVVARVAPARFTPPPVPFERRHLLGGLLFGTGWALSGACPSIALAALAQRRASAVIVLVGLVAGNWIWGELNDRWLNWSQRGCSTED